MRYIAEKTTVYVVAVILFIIGFGVAWLAIPPSRSDAVSYFTDKSWEDAEPILSEVGIEPPHAVVEKPEKLKVGIISPTTGLLASYGLGAHNGVDLYTEMVNDEGGILGVPVEVVHYSQGATPESTVDIVTKAIDEDEVDVLLGGPGTDDLLAAAPIVEEGKTIWLNGQAKSYRTAWKDPEDPSAGTYDWIFQSAGGNTPSQGAQAAFMIATQFPDVKRVQGVHLDYDYGWVMENAFVETIEKLRPDIEVLDPIWIPWTVTDFGPYITTIKDRNPDIVWGSVWGSYSTLMADAGATAGLWKGTGGDTIYFGYAHDFYVGENRPVPDWMFGNALVLSGSPNAGPTNTSYPAHVEWRETFKDEYGMLPNSSCYDALSGYFAWKQAIEKAYELKGSWPTDEEIREALEGLVVHNPLTNVWGYIREEDHLAQYPITTGWVAESDVYPYSVKPLMRMPMAYQSPLPLMTYADSVEAMEDYFSHWYWNPAKE